MITSRYRAAVVRALVLRGIKFCSGKDTKIVNVEQKKEKSEISIEKQKKDLQSAFSYLNKTQVDVPSVL